MKKQKTMIRSSLRALPYRERLKGYERDKDELLRVAAGLPAPEFQKMLDELIEKWGI